MTLNEPPQQTTQQNNATLYTSDLCTTVILTWEQIVEQVHILFYSAIVFVSFSSLTPITNFHIFRESV